MLQLEFASSSLVPSTCTLLRFSSRVYVVMYYCISFQLLQMKTMLYFASLLLLQAYDVIVVDEFVNCVTEQSVFGLVEHFRLHLVLDANWGIISGQTVRTIGRQINVHSGGIHLGL